MPVRYVGRGNGWGGSSYESVPECDMKHDIKKVRGKLYIVGLKCKCGAKTDSSISGSKVPCRKLNEMLIW